MPPDRRSGRAPRRLRRQRDAQRGTAPGRGRARFRGQNPRFRGPQVASGGPAPPVELPSRLNLTPALSVMTGGLSSLSPGTRQREWSMATSKVTVHPAAASPVPASPRADDMALVERCRAGDLAAFEELYKAHAGKLYSLAFRMLGNPADAEDLLQEIFLAAHRKLDGFRGESALGTWLYRLATNQCLDFLRSRASRSSQVTDTLDDDPGVY